ncbi:MAG: hypothetical protein ACREQF_10070 [Candidatus Binataceae bacterium]
MRSVVMSLVAAAGLAIVMCGFTPRAHAQAAVEYGTTTGGASSAAQGAKSIGNATADSLKRSSDATAGGYRRVEPKESTGRNKRSAQRSSRARRGGNTRSASRGNAGASRWPGTSIAKHRSMGEGMH